MSDSFFRRLEFATSRSLATLRSFARGSFSSSRIFMLFNAFWNEMEMKPATPMGAGRIQDGFWKGGNCLKMDLQEGRQLMAAALEIGLSENGEIGCIIALSFSRCKRLMLPPVY